MKKVLFILLGSLILLSFDNVAAQAPSKETKLYIKTKIDSITKDVDDSIKQIGHRVNNANETYKIAKEYSKSADNLVSIFLSIFTGIFALMGIGLVTIYFNATKKYKKILKNQYKTYKEKVDRLISTETNTLAIKKYTKIIFLFKEDNVDENKFFNEIQKAVLNEFEEDNISKAYANDISKIKDENYDNFLKDKSKLKVLIMNDDLFKEFWKSEEGFIKEDKKEELKGFFKKLKDNNIGFVLFGKTKLSDIKNEYKAYANEPYSLYANLNNLLKYMVVSKGIKF